MNKISSPLKLGQQGSEVADLQDVLQRCLAQNVILAGDKGTRRQLSTALRAERDQQLYGDATRDLVGMFQRERKLSPSGEVDEATATALKRWLDVLGEAEEVPPAFIAKDRIHQADGLPVAGVLDGKTAMGPNSARAKMSGGPVRRVVVVTLMAVSLIWCLFVTVFVSVTYWSGRLSTPAAIFYVGVLGVVPLVLLGGIGGYLIVRSKSQRLEDARPILPPDVYVVQGHVRNEIGEPVNDISIRVVFVPGENHSDETRTDQEGYYKIEYYEQQSRRSKKDSGGPDLIVSVRDARGATLATSREINNAQKIETVDLTITKAPLEPSFLVHGALLNPDGSPVVNATLKAFDKELRREIELSSAITGEDGAYIMAYRPSQLSSPNKGHADLIVRAYDRDNNEIAASLLICPAKDDEQVTLVIGNGPLIGKPEYDLLKERLTPLLKRNGPDGSDLSLAELTEADLDYFRTCQPDLEPAHLQYFVQAEQLSMEAQRLAPEAAVPSHAFYGLLRRDMGSSLEQLLDRPLPELGEALDAAMAENVILAIPSAQTLTDGFETLQIEQALQPGATGGPPSLGDMLSTTTLPLQTQRYFLYLYNRRRGLIEAFWQGLRQDPTFSANGGVEEIQFTLQLNLLTQSHLPLMRRLQQLRRNGEVSAIKDLARLNLMDWKRLITEPVDGQVVGAPAHVPGQDDTAKVEIYARAIAGLVEEAFPTAVVANRVVNDEIPDKDDLVAFFNQNPDFDFLRDYIAGRVATGRLRMEGVKDPGRLVGLVKAMQRVYRLAPRYDDMRALMSQGHDSAWHIVQTGRTRFKQAVADTLGEARAEQIYATAQKQASLALALLAKHHPAFNNLDMKVVPAGRYGDGNA